MVDCQPKIEQREITNLETTPFSHPVRCLDARLGSSLLREENRGTLVCRGTLSTHKCLRAESRKIGHTSIYNEQEISQQYSHSDRQHGGSFLFSENGGGARPIKF